MKFSLFRLDRLLRASDRKRLILVAFVLLLTVAVAFVGVAYATGKLDEWTNKEKTDDGLCKHEWAEATCTSPKLCTLCGEREGTTINHDLVDATCTNAMTCTMCHQNWGNELGHRWEAQSCTKPAYCKTCGLTEGEALGHDWADATCTVAKKCRTCNVEEGKELGHDYQEFVIEPTCTESGSVTVSCVRCGKVDEEKAEVTEALGHTYSEWHTAVAATCTEAGTKAHYECLVCHKYFDAEKIAMPSITVAVKGHTYPAENRIVVLNPTCTTKGTYVDTCSGCGAEKYGSTPALGHNYGSASCTEAATCTVCSFNNNGQIIGHDWIDATCDAPKTCARENCGATEGDPLGHDWTNATCAAPSACTRCETKNPEAVEVTHVIEYAYEQNTVVYRCTYCDAFFKLATSSFFISGENHNNITGLLNVTNGYVTADPKSDNPVLTPEGYYTLLKKETTTDKKQLQVWFPLQTAGLSGFTSNNSAVGFISFRMNAYMDSNLDITLVDGTSGDRWSKEWCFTDKAFIVSPPTKNEETGRTVVTISGWDGLVLKEVDVTDATTVEEKFTGWFDVYMGFVLDPVSDTIAIHYYIDGQYAGTCIRENTTTTNGFTCFYLSGNSNTAGSGVMFDDVAFGYTIAGYWGFDGQHDHDWTVSKVVDPTCTNDGYTIYTCSNGCIRRADVIPALGHLNDVTIDGSAPTCTTDGITSGTYCTVCQSVTSEQKVLPALGHTPGELLDSLETSCTADGFNKYFCTVCETEYTDVVPMLGHDYGEAKCDDVATCNRCLENSGVAIGHIWVDATCTAPKHCVREGCNVTEGDKLTHTLNHKYENSKLTYYCETCTTAFSINNGYYLNGTTFDGMTGNASNPNNFTVAPGTNKPASVDGHYELINTTGARGQLQLWIPADTTDSIGFTSSKNTVGFLSFKLNAFVDEDISIQLVDCASNQGENRWKSGGVAGKIIIKKLEEGKIKIELGSVAANGGFVQLATVASLPVGSDNFTGWVDIKFGIALDPDSDQITYHCFVDGTHVLSVSTELTTVSNSINAAYLSGYTSALGSGLMLDDIAFGCTANAEWLFDDCKHEYTKVVTPVSCLANGYTTSSCSLCGHVKISDVVKAPGSHTGGNATCSALAVCTRCSEPYGEYRDHVVGTAATCTTQAVCSTCHNSYGELLPHVVGTAATCTAQAVCRTCGTSYGDLKDHVVGTPATCTTAAICRNCDNPFGGYSGHIAASPTCAGATNCTACGANMPQTTHNIKATYSAKVLTYSCEYCDTSYQTVKSYYFNGTDSSFTNLVTADENGAYNGASNTAVINANGQYEFLHDDNTKSGKAVVWIPKNGSGSTLFDGFSTGNNAVGFLSFSVNSYMTSALSMQLVDTTLRGVSSNFWGEGALPECFRISAPSDGKVTVTGWTGTLKEITVGEDMYTGWIDVTIGIQLTSDDQVTLYYYIDGEYMGQATKQMTITSDKIDGAYFNGTSAVPNSGYMLDNIGMGYVTNGTWKYDK